MQLKVMKADGSVEEYLHTKVIGTISNVLGKTGQADICVAEQFAEVVTYFLYHQQNRRSVTSGEILSMIKAVLTGTGYEEAAIVLSEHHFERKLALLAEPEQSQSRSRWDKSTIVRDLVARHDLCRQTARMIASMVEEKIFSTGITLVPASLIKQLVLGDAAAVLRAQQQLQTA